MRRLLVIALLAAPLCGQSEASGLTGNLSVSGNVTLRVQIPAKPVWERVYEVPKEWGCTLLIGERCFATLKRILRPDDIPAVPVLINERYPATSVTVRPAAVEAYSSSISLFAPDSKEPMDESSASWILYALRLATRATGVL